MNLCKRSLTAALFVVGTMSLYGQVGVVLLETMDADTTNGRNSNVSMAVVRADATTSLASLAPLSVASSSLNESDPRAFDDRAGGMYLTFLVASTSTEESSDTDIAIEHRSADGEPLWTDSSGSSLRYVARSVHAEHSPEVVPTDDGVVVLYDLTYREGPHKGDVDVAARWIPTNDTVEGTSFWVAQSADTERLAGTFIAADGSIVAVIERTTSGGSDIVAVRLGKTGAVDWPDGSAESIVAAGRHNEHGSVVASDLYGGGVVAYELSYADGPRAGDTDIIAQRISGTGERLWIDRENPPIVAASTHSVESAPRIVVDSNGVTVAFEIDPKGPNDLSLVGLQRLDRTGHPQWDSGHRSVPFPLPGRAASMPIIVGDGTGGVFVVVEGRDSAGRGIDAYAQYFTRSGTALWASGRDGVPVYRGPMAERAFGLFVTGQRLVVVANELPVYRIDDGRSPDTSIVAQALDIEGRFAWEIGENNLMVARAPLSDEEPTLVVVGQ